jgi:hypothetical protein
MISLTSKKRLRTVRHLQPFHLFSSPSIGSSGSVLHQLFHVLTYCIRSGAAAGGVYVQRGGEPLGPGRLAAAGGFGPPAAAGGYSL